jgi:glycosyltransferase involved in cell wall biosynthesis
LLTLIVPVRDWPQERIDLCIRSFRELESSTLNEIVIVDFGSEVPVKAPRRDRFVRLLRLEAEVWSLAEAINAGVAVARNDIVAKTDADILVSPSSRAEFDGICAAITRGDFALGLAQATDLPASLNPAAAFKATRTPGSIGRLRAKWGQGGLVFFSRSTWNELGGFDARFTGWGNEDNDFAERLRRSGKRVQWADRDRLQIFHVWHPPSYAATGVLSQRLKNQKVAKDDKSVFRPLAFRHSNFTKVAPAVIKSFAPLVTLGIATTARPNRDRMIAEAVNSFRGQIDNDFEVLIVDNGSPKSSLPALQRTLEKIRWTESLRLETVPHGSIPAARNIISRLARGRYICVVDDDDIALPNRLADHLKVFAADGGVHGSHGGWIDFDESTGVIERNPGKQRGISTLLKGTGKITAHPASLYRTDVMRAVPYDESFALGSDFDLALRLANNGFEVPHTNSYLTLRRYHSANVTITGQSNQVSNGQLARSRTLASFDWQRIKGLEDEAKARNGDVYCRNQMSIESLAELIPGYSGHWQIYVPVSALTAGSGALTISGLDAVPAMHDALLSGPGVDAGSDSSAPSLLQRLVDIVPGDLCTRRTGLNQPVYFRSTSIAGLKRARKIKQQIEDLIGLPVELNSVRQAEIDREVAFDWRAMTINAGERILRSDRVADLSSLLGTLLVLAQDSLLRSSLSILADFDEEGEAYYLVTASIKGLDSLRQLEFDLERRLKLPFRQVAAQGVLSELTPSTRSH